MLRNRHRLQQLDKDHGAIVNLPSHIKQHIFASQPPSPPASSPSIPVKRSVSDYFESTNKVLKTSSVSVSQSESESPSLLQEIQEIKASLKRIEQFLGISV
jgi:hypothetical protein